MGREPYDKELETNLNHQQISTNHLQGIAGISIRDQQLAL